MSEFYFLKIILAGFIYIVTPGPVFLSIVSLVATQGRVPGFRLVSGAILGCMIWVTLTAASLIEADRLPPVIFKALAVLSAFYLFWLGSRMFVKALSSRENVVFKRPFVDGFALGFFNPKSYPVMMVVFSALLLHQDHVIGWPDFPLFFVFAVCGFALGYIFMVGLAGVKTLSALYMRHLKIFSYGFGVLYIGFGLHLLLNVFYGTST